MSAKRDATVKRMSEAPAVKSEPMRIGTGRNAQVACRGNPVAQRIRSRGRIESSRLTMPPPRAEAMKTERGTNIRLASSLEPWVLSAAVVEVCEKKAQKIEPVMK
jgi:hypothetical protein